MNLTESLRMALTSLRTNKMRSLLTLLGVIIGIAAVIAILTLGSALKGQFTSDLDKVGANNFQVQVKERTDEGETDYNVESSVDDPDSLLTPEQLEQVRTALAPDVEGVIIGEYDTYPGDLTPEGASKSSAVMVQPTNPDYVTASQFTVRTGRALTDDDIAADRAVTMLSAATATELFGDADPVGQTLNFAPLDGTDLELTVIGVYDSHATGALIGGGGPEHALVPYPLAAQLSDAPLAGEAFSSVSIRAAAGTDKAALGARLQAAFDSMYADNEDYRVEVTDFSKDLASLNQLLTALSAAIAAIGGISLLVGGIGVMNIMLITVTERTREIGVRKALGARRRDIRLQFVTEAIIVCLIGGLIGVVLGSVAGMIGSSLMGYFVFPPLGAIVVSLLFALAIGLFFGYYPAGKAAKLDPIEALRYE
ncbi:ABC transporter permease [Corynebacterium striatum]|uniref:ABC transporter permease n=1 Tax=Corynebacterium striatum TaxID=43770 RepID=A0AAQ1TU71_CORST|nr:ABC transporter permease [Corynebacterium striatum]EEI78160.1 efflux ABC transporter, permease protein [Corynebacterium striatum ATCC 6940]EGT5574787.1 FtsX-like permease family protein [Corynebacterium striatum]EGT5788184.1 FtsX-like permease family protein [Corynebacterium striatum]MDK8788052.1 ABC transporter permease [Corynebacterium striatum]QQE52775.1 ABC transporter permease [Corynebacterium striatum]